MTIINLFSKKQKELRGEVNDVYTYDRLPKEFSETKPRSPQTNGIGERFNRTIHDEFYTIAFRKRIYSTLAQIQEDLDAWAKKYNTNRTHTGKYCFGRTPLQTFEETLHLAKEKQLDDLPPAA